MKTQVKGFTLIELLITVTIVGILAGIAIPNYADYVRKARRNDAREALLRTAGALEKYMLNNNAYTTDITAVPGAGTTSADGYYTLAIANDAGTYSITATATGIQAADTRCATFTYFLDGRQTAAAGDGSDTSVECWPD